MEALEDRRMLSVARFESVGGDLQVEDLAGQADDWVLLREADQIVLRDRAQDNLLLGSISRFEVTGQIVVSAADGDDRLMLDLSGGSPFPAGGIVIDGGQGANELLIVGGSQGDVEYSLDNATGGEAALSGFGVITFASVGRITNTRAADNVTLQLPPNLAHMAFLGDAVDRPGAIRLSGASLGVVDFASPSGSLTILGEGADDAIALGAMSNLVAATVLGAEDNPLQAITVSGAVNLGANDFTAYAERIRVEAPLAAGNIHLDADAGAQAQSSYTAALFSANVTASGSLTIVGWGGNFSDNYGVQVTTGAVVSAEGAVLVEGRGGGGGTVANAHGVYLASGGVIASTGLSAQSTVVVRGYGGNRSGVGSGNRGVYITGGNSRISSAQGAILVEGTGGGAGTGGNNVGVHVDGGGAIVGYGEGADSSVTIQGSGGSLGGTGGSSNYGVYVNGTNSRIASAGGPLDVEGTGGGSGSGAGNFGVFVNSNAAIRNTGSNASSTTTVIGSGGNASGTGGNNNTGVNVNSDGRIESFGGAVVVEGVGGGGGTSSFSHGVRLGAAGAIANTGTESTATVTVKGIGGSPSGGGSNHYGVLVTGLNDRHSQITTAGGALFIEAGGTSSSVVALRLENGAALATGADASLAIVADNVQIEPTAGISAGAGAASIQPRTPGTLIDLGGDDVFADSPATLGLSSDELLRITAGALAIGSLASGDLTISADLVRAEATNIELLGGNDILLGGYQIQSAGGNISAAARRRIALSSGGGVSAGGGHIALSANQQAIPTSGDFLGVHVDGGVVETLGEGRIVVQGRGGDAVAGSQHGVVVSGGGRIGSAAAGGVAIFGQGGASAGNDNYGVVVNGADSLITSGGAILVDGLGGGTGFAGHGVAVYTGAKIAASGAGTVTVNGQGSTSGNSYTMGVVLVNAGAEITSAGGQVTVSGGGGGTGSTGWNYGVIVESQASISAGGDGRLIVSGQGGATSGSNNHGVYLRNAGTIQTSGAGTIAVTGTGRGVSTGGSNDGVRVESGSQIAALGTGTVSVEGAGGSSSGNSNLGVHVTGAGSQIIASGGDLTVDGLGGGTQASTSNYGVAVGGQGRIVAGGDGDLTVVGEGGASTGERNYGVQLGGGSILAFGAGTLSVTGISGANSTGIFNVGVRVDPNGQITGSGTGAVIVEGTGRGATGNQGTGVRLEGAGALIAAAGPLTVLGESTAAGAATNSWGVDVAGGAKIRGTAANWVTVHGTGAKGTGNGNTGVFVRQAGSEISSEGGAIHVTGVGGGASSSASNAGVRLEAGGVIGAGASSVRVEGTGGAASGSFNHGVIMLGAATRITSGSGDVTVTGTGGGINNSTTNYGVNLASGSSIIAGGLGSVQVDGQGGTTAGANNRGVFVTGANTQITSNGGDVSVNGTGGGAGGSGNNHGVAVDQGALVSAGGGGQVLVRGQGGAGGGASNFGVAVNALNTQITSSGGPVVVRGIGGGANTSASNVGVQLTNSATITAGGLGSVSVEGQGGAAAGDRNYGLYILNSGAKITSSGGDVHVAGTGGDGASRFNYGMMLQNTGQILAGGSGDVFVHGRGGAAESGDQYGVYVRDTGSQISSSGGDVEVVGIGGGSGAANVNLGVYLFNSAKIASGGTGSVAVQGQGGPTAGVANIGVYLIGSGSQITSSGAVTITGNGGPNAVGIHLLDGGSIVTSNNAPVSLVTDTLSISGSPLGSVDAGDGALALQPYTSGTHIALGGADVPSESPRVLGISAGELAQFTAGSLQLGSPDSGPMTVTEPLTFDVPVSLVTGGEIMLSSATPITAPVVNLLGALRFSDSPAALTLEGDLNLGASSTFAAELEGLATGQYDVLSVAGDVALNGARLNLSGSPASLGGEQIVILDNQGAQAVTGQFSFGLAINGFPLSVPRTLSEGDVLLSNLGGVVARISYVGGDGNDVAILFDQPGVDTFDALAVSESLQTGIAAVFDALPAWNARLNASSSLGLDLPLIDGNFGQALRLDETLETSLERPVVDSANTRQELENAITAAGLVLLPAGDDGDLVRVQFTRTLVGLNGVEPLKPASLGLLAGLATTADLTGSFTYDADLVISLIFGVDETGFYLAGESGLTLTTEATGDVSGNYALPLGNLGVTAAGTVSADLAVAVAGADGVKRRVSDLIASPSSGLASDIDGVTRLQLVQDISPLGLDFGAAWMATIDNGQVAGITSDVQWPDQDQFAAATLGHLADQLEDALGAELFEQLLALAPPLTDGQAPLATSVAGGRNDLAPYLEQMGLLLSPVLNFLRNVSGQSPARSFGDILHNAVSTRDAFNVTGEGVRVGVISDGIQGHGRVNGWELTPEKFGGYGRFGSGSEGVAMMEIIHDLAPDAELYFYGVVGGDLRFNFLDAIRYLVEEAKVDILVDDIGIHTEPFFQAGIISDAYAAVKALYPDLLIVSAAGNDAQMHHQDAFNPGPKTVSVPGQGASQLFVAHHFGPDGEEVPWMRVRMGKNDASAFLQWADDYYLPSSEYILAMVTPLVDESGQPLLDSQGRYQFIIDQASGDFNHWAAPGELLPSVRRAFQSVSLPGVGEVHETHIAVLQYSTLADVDQFHADVSTSIPLQFEIISYNMWPALQSPLDTIYGHPLTAHLAVGAVHVDDPMADDLSPDGVASYSSIGYSLQRDADDLVLVGALDVVAYSNVQVSGVGGFPTPFAGTSAAAPHVAAVAALLKQLRPQAAGEQLAAAITNTAVDMLGVMVYDSWDPSAEPAVVGFGEGYDQVTGHGLVDAFAAAEYLAAQLPVHNGLPASRTRTPADSTWFADLWARAETEYEAFYGAGAVYNHSRTAATRNAFPFDLAEVLGNFGVEIESRLSNQQIIGLLSGQSLPSDADWLRLTYTTDPEDFSPLTLSYGASVDDLPLLEGASIEGRIRAALQPLLELTFGIDAAGFFVDPQSKIGAKMELSGDLTGTAGPFEAGVNVTGEMSPQLNISGMDVNGDGKLRLSEFANVLETRLEIGTTQVDAAIDLKLGFLDYVDADGNPNNNSPNGGDPFKFGASTTFHIVEGADGLPVFAKGLIDLKNPDVNGDDEDDFTTRVLLENMVRYGRDQVGEWFDLQSLQGQLDTLGDLAGSNASLSQLLDFANSLTTFDADSLSQAADISPGATLAGGITVKQIVTFEQIQTWLNEGLPANAVDLIQIEVASFQASAGGATFNLAEFLPGGLAEQGWTASVALQNPRLSGSLLFGVDTSASPFYLGTAAAPSESGIQSQSKLSASAAVQVSLANPSLFDGRLVLNDVSGGFTPRLSIDFAGTGGVDGRLRLDELAGLANAQVEAFDNALESSFLRMRGALALPGLEDDQGEPVLLQVYGSLAGKADVWELRSNLADDQNVKLGGYRVTDLAVSVESRKLTESTRSLTAIVRGSMEVPFGEDGNPLTVSFQGALGASGLHLTGSLEFGDRLIGPEKSPLLWLDGVKLALDMTIPKAEGAPIQGGITVEAAVVDVFPKVGFKEKKAEAAGPESSPSDPPDNPPVDLEQLEDDRKTAALEVGYYLEISKDAAMERYGEELIVPASELLKLSVSLGNTARERRPELDAALNAVQALKESATPAELQAYAASKEGPIAVTLDKISLPILVEGFSLPVEALQTETDFGASHLLKLRALEILITGPRDSIQYDRQTYLDIKSLGLEIGLDKAERRMWTIAYNLPEVVANSNSVRAADIRTLIEAESYLLDLGTGVEPVSTDPETYARFDTLGREVALNHAQKRMLVPAFNAPPSIVEETAILASDVLAFQSIAATAELDDEMRFVTDESFYQRIKNEGREATFEFARKTAVTEKFTDKFTTPEIAALAVNSAVTGHQLLLLASRDDYPVEKLADPEFYARIANPNVGLEGAVAWANGRILGSGLLDRLKFEPISAGMRVTGLVGSIYSDGRMKLEVSAASLFVGEILKLDAVGVPASNTPALKVNLDPKGIDPTVNFVELAGITASIPLFDQLPTATLSSLAISRTKLSLGELILQQPQLELGFGEGDARQTLLRADNVRVTLPAQELDFAAGLKLPRLDGLSFASDSAVILPGLGENGLARVSDASILYENGILRVDVPTFNFEFGPFTTEVTGAKLNVGQGLGYHLAVALENLPLVEVGQATLRLATDPDSDLTFTARRLKVLAGLDDFNLPRVRLGSISLSSEEGIADSLGFGDLLPFDVTDLTIASNAALNENDEFFVSATGKFNFDLLKNKLPFDPFLEFRANDDDAAPLVRDGGEDGRITSNSDPDNLFEVTVIVGPDGPRLQALPGRITLGFDNWEVGAFVFEGAMHLGSFSGGLPESFGGYLQLEKNPSANPDRPALSEANELSDEEQAEHGFFNASLDNLRLDIVGKYTPAASLDPYAIDRFAKLDVSASLDAGLRLKFGDFLELYGFGGSVSLVVTEDRSDNVFDPDAAFSLDSISVDLVKFALGDYFAFQAEDATFNFTDAAKPFMEVGSIGLSSAALGLGGTVSGLEINRRGVPQYDSIDSVNITLGGENGVLGDVLNFFPIVVDGLGFQLKEGFYERNDKGDVTGIANAEQVSVLISGGMQQPKNWPESLRWPITARVTDLEVDIEKVLDPSKGFPLNLNTEIEVGLSPFELGPVTIGGSLVLGVVRDDPAPGEMFGDIVYARFNSEGRIEKVESDDLRNVTDAVPLIYGRVMGVFNGFDISGGVDLVLSPLGPTQARLILPASVPLGTTPFILSQVSGGINFGVTELRSVEHPRELVTDEIFFDPFELDTATVRQSILDALEEGVFTLQRPFTVGLSGTVTTTLPGIVTGEAAFVVNVATNQMGLDLGDAGETPEINTGVRFLGSGTLSILGMPLGRAGILLDQSNLFSPELSVAFSIPSPDSPLGFLMNVQAELFGKLDVGGANLVGLAALRTFVEELAAGVGEEVFERLADALNDSPHKPLAVLLAGTDAPDDFEFTGDWLQQRLLGEDGLLPGPDDLTAVMNATIPDEEGNLSDRIVTLGKLLSAFVPEIPALFLDLETLRAALRGEPAAVQTVAQKSAEGLTAFSSIFVESVLKASGAAYESFNPSLLVEGRIEPVIYGMRMDSATAAGIYLDKTGLRVNLETGILSLLKLWPSFGPIIAVSPLGPLNDRVEVDAVLNFPDPREFMRLLLEPFDAEANVDRYRLVVSELPAGLEPELLSKVILVQPELPVDYDPINHPERYPYTIVTDAMQIADSVVQFTRVDEFTEALANISAAPYSLELLDYFVDVVNPLSDHWQIGLLGSLSGYGFDNLMEFAGIAFGPQFDDGRFDLGAVVADRLRLVVAELPDPDELPAALLPLVILIDPDGYPLGYDPAGPNAEFPYRIFVSEDALLDYERENGTSYIKMFRADRFADVVRFGGLAVTGDLRLPRVLSDPLGVYQAIHDYTWPDGRSGWIPPPLPEISGERFQDIQSFLAMLGEVGTFAGDALDYARRLAEGLTTTEKFSRVELFVPSPAGFFDLDSYRFPTTDPNADPLASYFDVPEGDEEQTELFGALLDLFNAGYLTGWDNLNLLGVNWGTSRYDASLQGIELEAFLPLLAGLRVEVLAGTREVSLLEVAGDLLESPLVSTFVGDPEATVTGGLNILDAVLAAFDLDLPSFEQIQNAWRNGEDVAPLLPASVRDRLNPSQLEDAVDYLGSLLTLVDIKLPVPVAKGELSLGTENFSQWVDAAYAADAPALARRLMARLFGEDFFTDGFQPASLIPSDLANLTVGVYTPMASEPVPGVPNTVEQNGGFRFGLEMNVPNLFERSSVTFEVQATPALADLSVVDLLGVPNFKAEVATQRLVLPNLPRLGAPGANEFLSLNDFSIGLERNSEGTFAQLDGTINLLGRDGLRAMGRLEMSQGGNVVGVLQIALNPGETLSLNGVALSGNFFLHVNTTDAEATYGEGDAAVTILPGAGVFVEGQMTVNGITLAAGKFNLQTNGANRLDVNAEGVVSFLGQSIAAKGDLVIGRGAGSTASLTASGSLSLMLTDVDLPLPGGWSLEQAEANARFSFGLFNGPGSFNFELVRAELSLPVLADPVVVSGTFSQTGLRTRGIINGTLADVPLLFTGQQLKLSGSFTFNLDAGGGPATDLAEFRGSFVSLKLADFGLVTVRELSLSTTGALYLKVDDPAPVGFGSNASRFEIDLPGFEITTDANQPSFAFTVDGASVTAPGLGTKTVPQMTFQSDGSFAVTLAAGEQADFGVFSLGGQMQLRSQGFGAGVELRFLTFEGVKPWLRVANPIPGRPAVFDVEMDPFTLRSTGTLESITANQAAAGRLVRLGEADVLEVTGASITVKFDVADGVYVALSNGQLRLLGTSAGTLSPFVIQAGGLAKLGQTLSAAASDVFDFDSLPLTNVFSRLGDLPGMAIERLGTIQRSLGLSLRFGDNGLELSQRSTTPLSIPLFGTDVTFQNLKVASNGVTEFDLFGDLDAFGIFKIEGQDRMLFRRDASGVSSLDFRRKLVNVGGTMVPERLIRLTLQDPLSASNKIVDIALTSDLYWSSNGALQRSSISTAAVLGEGRIGNDWLRLNANFALASTGGVVRLDVSNVSLQLPFGGEKSIPGAVRLSLGGGLSSQPSFPGNTAFQDYFNIPLGNLVDNALATFNAGNGLFNLTLARDTGFTLALRPGQTIPLTIFQSGLTITSFSASTNGAFLADVRGQLALRSPYDEFAKFDLSSNVHFTLERRQNGPLTLWLNPSPNTREYLLPFGGNLDLTGFLSTNGQFSFVGDLSLGSVTYTIPLTNISITQTLPTARVFLTHERMFIEGDFFGNGTIYSGRLLHNGTALVQVGGATVPIVLPGGWTSTLHANTAQHLHTLWRQGLEAGQDLLEFGLERLEDLAAAVDQGLREAADAARRLLEDGAEAVQELAEQGAELLGQIYEIEINIFNSYIDDGFVFFDSNGNRIHDFIDANGNGQYDLGEWIEPFTAVVNGQAVLHVADLFDRNGDGRIDPEDGVLVVASGTNTATGQPLAAPMLGWIDGDSGQATPLTTLAAAMSQAYAFTPAEALAQALALLGLPDVNLLTLDPLAETAQGSTEAAEVLAWHVIVANTAAQTSALLGGLLDADPVSLNSAAYLALAERLIDQGGEAFDLTSAADIELLLRQAFARLDSIVDDEIASGASGLQAISQVIADSNRLVLETPRSATYEYLDDLLRIEVVAQNGAANDLILLAGGVLNPAELLDRYDEESLAEAVQEAEPVQVLPVTLAVETLTPIVEGGRAVLNGAYTDPSFGLEHVVTVEWDDPHDGRASTFQLGRTGMLAASQEIPSTTDDGVLTILEVDALGTVRFQAARRILNNRPLDHDGLTPQAFLVQTRVSNDTSSATVVEPLVVLNAAPVIEQLSTTASEPGGARPGTAVALQVSFTDPGWLDAHRVQIHWGDGTVSDSHVAADRVLIDATEGMGEAVASHRYAEAGVYHVELTTIDDDGAAARASTTVYVTGVRLAGDGVLEIVGTAGRDHVNVLRIGPPSAGTIRVNAMFDQGVSSGPPLVFNAAQSSVTGIRLVLGAGDDHAVVHPLITASAWMEGGPGNDLLLGGGGNDTLIGGTGINTLLGGGGNDVLVSASIFDVIQGGTGHDLIIGAMNADILADRCLASLTPTGDLMIADWTRHPDRVEEAAQVLALWAIGWRADLDHDELLEGLLAIMRRDADESVHNALFADLEALGDLLDLGK